MTKKGTPLKRYKVYGYDASGEYKEWRVIADSPADALRQVRKITGMPVEYVAKQFNWQRIY